MLIEPASKVSVPLTVVIRTRSKVPPSDGSPVNWPELSEAGCKFYKNPFGRGKDVLVISGGNRDTRRDIVEGFVKLL